MSFGSVTVACFTSFDDEFWCGFCFDLALFEDSYEASLIALFMILSLGSLRVFTKSLIDPDLWLIVWLGYVLRGANGISVIMGFEWGSNLACHIWAEMGSLNSGSTISVSLNFYMNLKWISAVWEMIAFDIIFCRSSSSFFVKIWAPGHFMHNWGSVWLIDVTIFHLYS